MFIINALQSSFEFDSDISLQIKRYCFFLKEAAQNFLCCKISWC